MFYTKWMDAFCGPSARFGPRERSESPQNAQETPKTPAPGPQNLHLHLLMQSQSLSGALREPPKRPKRSQNASPRPPKKPQTRPRRDSAVPSGSHTSPAVPSGLGALKGLRSRQPVKLPMRAVVLKKICCHRAGARFFRATREHRLARAVVPKSLPRERSGSPQNGQKDPKTPASKPPKTPKQAEERLTCWEFM